MNITEHEMRGLLTGKCLPGDMRLNEELPAYLVRKFTELKAQRDALGAENAALKVISNDRRVFIMNGVQLGYIKVPTVETDPALETIRIAVSPQEPTPATDAYLNSVRAEGVEMLAAQCDGYPLNHVYTYTKGHAKDFAAQIRAGEPS